MNIITKVGTMSSLFNSASQNIKMETHDEVMSRLKFIGNIQEGEKVNVKNMYIQPYGLVTSISRTVYNQDNRHNTLTFVVNTIKRSFDLLNLYLNSKLTSELMMCYNIFLDLENASNGLKNLKKTYNHDLMFCCKIDTLLQEITVILEEVKKTLKSQPEKIQTSVSVSESDEDLDITSTSL